MDAARAFLERFADELGRPQAKIRATHLPGHLPPLRAIPLDLVQYYHQHDYKEALRPVLGYQVPEGHLLYVDHVGLSGNIFQSPSAWDWFAANVYWAVDGKRTCRFGPSSCGVTRGDLSTGAGPAALGEQSPLLYSMADISPLGLVSPIMNPGNASDAINRSHCGHSPLFGLFHKTEGPRAIYLPGQVVEIVYKYVGTIANRVTYLSHQINMGSGVAGVLPGTAGTPGYDDGSHGATFAAQDFTGLLQADLDDTDRVTAAAGPIDLAAAVNSTAFSVDNAAAQADHLRNQILIFLDRRPGGAGLLEAQAEVDRITWRVGVSGDNQTWTERDVHAARYYEILGTGIPGNGNLRWIEITFTEHAWRGTGSDNRTHQYLKAWVEAGAFLTTAQVTEVQPSLGIRHQIAARIAGHLWQPTSAGEGTGGRRRT